MNALRRAGAALVATGAAVVLTAAPAAAASTLAVDPGEVTSAGNVALTGTLDTGFPNGDADSGTAQLRVVVPGDGSVVRVLPRSQQDTDRRRATASVGTAAPCTLPDEPACAAGLDLPNGTYGVELWEVGRTFGADRRLTTAPLVVDVPARAPSGVKATLGDDRSVTVRWDRGTEPDLLRWEVGDGAGRSTTVTPDACSKNGCSTVFAYRVTDSGTRAYTVTATRACGRAACTAKAGGSATTAPVTLPATTEPGSTAAPGAGGTPSAAAGSGTPPAGAGKAAVDPRAFAQSFGSFAPKLGVSKLPPLPQTGPAVATPTLPDGTFDPTLDYGDQEPAAAPEPVTAAPGRGLTRLTSSGGVLGDEQVVRGIAAALVLGLSGAHLRTWLNRALPDDL